MRRLRRIGLVILVVVLAAMAYRVLGVYQFRSAQCTATPPARLTQTYPANLRVMTFNIEGHASLLRAGHIEEVAAAIRKHDPDIVGINEAHRGTWQARFDDHVEQLRLLTGLNVAFGRSYTFMGGQFGNAVLTKGEIVSVDVHPLPGTGEPRSLLECVIRINGGLIDFYVTHTTAWASIGRAARTEQLECIAAHVQSSPHPYILTGDLNAPPESPELERFLQGQEMIQVGNPTTATHRVMEQKLDYILADRGWVVRSAQVVDDGPSDHRPMIAELTHP